jgi:Cu+-exporting ATPase
MPARRIMTAQTSDQTSPGITPARVELAVDGMTCASCAVRIEKKLNRMVGVAATVNYATETATVNYDAGTVTPEALVATVEATGYRNPRRLKIPPEARKLGPTTTKPTRYGSDSPSRRY